MPIYRYFSVISVILTLACHQVQAQDSLVKNSIYDLTLEELLKLRVVSIATGTPQLLHQAPAVATVITADKIAAMGATDLDDILETVPGLHITRLANGHQPLYIFRGIYGSFNPQVLVLINGVPITNSFVGNRSQIWGGMPVAAISRVEIIRGPGSAIYGADAFAGVINVITKNTDEIKGNEVALRLGSFNTTDFWFSHGGRYGDLKASFIYEHHKTAGFTGSIQADAQTVLDAKFGTNATLAPGSVNQLRRNDDLRVDLAYGNWRLRSGLQKRFMALGVGIAEALDPDGRESSQRFNTDLSYQSSKGKDWSVEGLLSYFNTSQEVEGDYHLFPAGADIGSGPYPQGVIGNPSIWERHSRASLVTRYEGVKNHHFSVGVGYSIDDLYRITESKNVALGPTGEVLGPNSPVVDVTDTEFIFLHERDRSERYIYVQDVWKIAADWEMTAGVRHDDYSDFGQTTNPRLALVWTQSPSLSAKALYGRAFRAPTFAELGLINNPVTLGNPNVGPEDMENLELAFDYHPQTDTQLVVSFFKYQWENIIGFVPEQDLDGSISDIAQNTGRQHGYGMELDLSYQLSPSLSLMGNFAWQKSTNQKTGEQAPYAPQQQVYLAFDYTFSDELSVVVKSRWILNRLRATDDPRAKPEDYTITDLSLNWRPKGQPYRFALIPKNLFDDDARYLTINAGSAVNIPGDLPMEGRNIMAQMQYQF